MKRQLLIIALLSSPIIAIYGTIPLFLFKILNLEVYLFLALGTLVMIMVSWLTQIYLVLRFPKINSVLLFVLSYLIVLVFRLIGIFIEDFFAVLPPKLDPQFLFYPILSSLAINGIQQIIILSVVRNHKLSTMKLEVQELKLQNLEGQRSILTQQLEPHFLFNTLSSLKSLINEDPKNADAYVLRLSDFLRYTLQVNQKAIVTLNEEIGFLQDYISLQKMRFENALNFRISDPIPTHGHLPIMALQIVVENCFKHNYLSENNRLTIQVQFNEQEVIIENTRSPRKNVQSSGIGLENLDKRYQLISGKRIEVIKTEKTFTVKLPLI